MKKLIASPRSGRGIAASTFSSRIPAMITSARVRPIPEPTAYTSPARPSGTDTGYS